MGFDGKTLIHPDQLAVANEVFAPSADDLALAEAAGRGLRGGRGARRGRGGGRTDASSRTCTSPTARRLLARAAAIAALEAARMTLLVLGLVALDRWRTVFKRVGAGRARRRWTRRSATGRREGVMALR